MHQERILDQSAAKLQSYLLVQRRLKWARLHAEPQPPLNASHLVAAGLLLFLLWLTKVIVLDPLLRAA